MRHSLLTAAETEFAVLGERMALSIEEASRSIGVSERTFRTMVTRGEVRSVRVGRRVLIPVEALRGLLGQTGAMS